MEKGSGTALRRPFGVFVRSGSMPRPLRTAPGGFVYHVLNRANGKRRIFEGDRDYLAFERVLAEVQERVAMRILAWCVMPNHWHLLLWPRRDGDLSNYMRLVTLTHTQRRHAHRGSAGTGHLYQGRSGRTCPRLALGKSLAPRARKAGAAAVHRLVARRTAKRLARLREPAGSDHGARRSAQMHAARISLWRRGLGGERRRPVGAEVHLATARTACQRGWDS